MSRVGFTTLERSARAAANEVRVLHGTDDAFWDYYKVTICHFDVNIEGSGSMKITKFPLVIALFFGLIFLANSRAAAQNLALCQPPEISAAVYNFVPEKDLQTGDFCPLMKSETAFVLKLRDAESFDISDYTTQILPAEIAPETPPISGELAPLPTQIPDPYFFVGQITKTANGFLLSVQLKKSSDSSLLNEVKTSFAVAANAETAGNQSATAMLAFFQTLAQKAHINRDSSDYAMDPHIDLTINKLFLKPNETSPVKIVLTDCDGVRLKNRTIEAFLQLKHGDATVQQDTLVRVTDENGERNGAIGAKAPGVITYIAKFKYKDMMGVPHERTDTKTIVVSGGEAHLWQMRADIQTETSTLYFSTDKQSGKWSGRRYLIRKKASMVFVFKADDTDPSGEVATDEIKNFNGYGEVYLRDKAINAQESAELHVASGKLDQSQTAAASLQAGFSISPTNHEFQVSLNNVEFGGAEELFAVRSNPYNYVHKTGIEYREGMGGGGSAPITTQMTKSGVYTFRKFERKLINDPEKSALSQGGTTGYELTKYDFEIRRVDSGSIGLIKK